MPISLDEAVSIFLANLTPGEINQSVAYVATQVVTGKSLKFPRISIIVPWHGFIAFVDRDPLANWSHSCRYILLNNETAEIRSFEAKFPPFHNDQMRWRVIFKAPSIPAEVVAIKD